MDTREAVSTIVNIVKNQNRIVFSTGYISRVATEIGSFKNHFYMLGSMGLASIIGIGISLCTEEYVVVIEGDGSFLMNPSSPYLVKLTGVKNFIHIIIDNGVYESTGGQRISKEISIFGSNIGRDFYKTSTHLESISSLSHHLPQRLKSEGPHLIVILAQEKMSIPPRVITDPSQITNLFRTRFPISTGAV